MTARYEAVKGGLRIEHRNGSWAVLHDGSGLEAASGLRQRRFAEEARDDFLATGTDFTQDKRAVSADRDRWRPACFTWQLRRRQRAFDGTTFEYYSADVHVGTFVPSARWAAEMRAAAAAGDREAASPLLAPVPHRQADQVIIPRGQESRS